MEPHVSGRVAEVERLLQALALLRHSELPVARSALVAAVHAYAEDARAAKAQADPVQRAKGLEALEKKIGHDLKKLGELGFEVQSTSGPGVESTWVLRPTPWRVPLALDPVETATLSWVMRALDGEQAVTADVPSGLEGARLWSLGGPVPEALGLVHTALAGGRALLVERDGQQTTVEPAQLASFEGRWYLLARYAGSDQVYGFRLDRLDVVGLGPVLLTPPVRVEDPREVLDPTGWRADPPFAVELRCDPADRAHVLSWFPRAVVTREDDDVVLRFPATHRANVLDRVIGLAGAARLVAPVDLVAELRARLSPFAAA